MITEETGRTIQRRLYARKNLLGLPCHKCWMQEIVQRDASVENVASTHQASLGWITSSFLWWHILQDQFTWTAWLKISFTLTTNARMTLDCTLCLKKRDPDIIDC